MDHRDHVALIRDGVAGAGPRWLELGAGDGAFTLALADLLGSQADILAVDRDRTALLRMPDGPFDGVLAANSLHFVREGSWHVRAILPAIRTKEAP